MLSLVQDCRRSVTPVTGMLLLFALAGCNNDPLGLQPVTGTVTVDGKPAAGVRLVFCPVTASPEAMQQRPLGITDAEGKYSLTTLVPGDGIAIGDYTVTATWVVGDKEDASGRRVSGVDRFRKTYAYPDSSQIKVTIDGKQDELIPIELHLPSER